MYLFFFSSRVSHKRRFICFFLYSRPGGSWKLVPAARKASGVGRKPDLSAICLPIWRARGVEGIFFTTRPPAPELGVLGELVMQTSPRRTARRGLSFVYVDVGSRRARTSVRQDGASKALLPVQVFRKRGRATERESYCASPRPRGRGPRVQAKSLGHARVLLEERFREGGELLSMPLAVPGPEVVAFSVPDPQGLLPRPLAARTFSNVHPGASANSLGVRRRAKGSPEGLRPQIPDGSWTGNDVHLI